MSRKLPAFSWAEISLHDKEDDLWIVYKGKVYDVTSFGEHPGGFDLLLAEGGRQQCYC